MGESAAGDGLGRPRVVLSRCLEQAACRYNAETIRSGVVRLLEPHVEFVATCPEVEIGLGVPRDPIRIVAGDGGAVGDGGQSSDPDHAGDPGHVDVADRAGLRLVQPSTGRDLTDAMVGFGHRFADETDAVDGLLLKSRSPSCGVTDAKRFAGAGDAPVTGKGAGLFAGVMADRYPLAAMEDEGRLTNAGVRHHWLTRVFASVALRAALAEGAAGLVDFHTRYKLVLMAHSPEGQRELGRLVARAGDAFDDVAPAYREGFAEAVAEPAGRGAHVNVIQHARGYFKEELSAAEKRQLESLEAGYRDGQLPLQALLVVLGSWVERFDEPYLRRQAYFRPYPAPLVVAADSGRGRLS